LPSNEVKIKPSDGAAGDEFGKHQGVAIGYGKIVVAAYLDNDNGTDSGSAYIFDLDGTQLAKIKASDGGADDFFGIAVTIGSGRIVVGAHGWDGTISNQGAAYIFDLSGTQIARIQASDPASFDNFGFSVAAGSDRIVVGAWGDDDLGSLSGSAYIFSLNGSQIAKIKASDGAADDYFGQAVAVGNGRIVVGAYGDSSGTGAAYIFDLNGTQLAKITASDGANLDWFGRSVAAGSGRIVIGAHQNNDNGTYSGSAYIFDLDGNEIAKITASDAAAGDNFGRAVAVGNGRICVGAHKDNSQAGSAYIFDLDGNQLAKIAASDGAANDQFGQAVAIGSGRIIVGAWGDADNGSTSGSAYIWTTPRVYNAWDAHDLEKYGD
jgi:hypothetical protein